MGAKGAFILSQANARQLSSRASTVDAPSIVGINNWDFGVSGTFGWFIGGQPATSVIDRIDFANDGNTALARTNTLGGAGITSHAAVSNQNYSWTAYNSTVERLDFSNDSNLPIIRGFMQETVLSRPTGVSNNNFGWFAGQLAPGVLSQTNVNRIDFANDLTQASRRGNLSTNRASGSAGVSNAFYGWIAGGNTPPVAGGPYSSIERIDFSNDTPTAVNRSNLTAANVDLAADGNINFGWFAGGTTPAPALISTIQRIEYANDTVAATARGPLPAVTRNFSGAGNTNFGWFGGGGNAVPAVVSIVNRIDFANDSPTSATARGSLSIARSSVKAVSNINSTVPSTLYPTQPLGTNEALAGYVWSAGGGNPGYVSRIERIDLSNDSPTSASTRGSLLSARSFSGASNAGYGWFGLGNGTLGNNQTIVERLDFANDSPSSTSARGLFTVGRFEAAAAGNANYGWFGGGYRAGGFGVQTLVDRIDFANDSPTAPSLRGPLTSGRRNLAAVNNSNFGWWAGGVDTVPNVYVTIERIDFANDSPTTASPRGALTTARGHLAAAGNDNYGWFGGGFFPGPFAFYSVVNRVDYSNDSPTASSIRATLNTSRAVYGAAGNANYGWWIGGTTTGTSLVERMEYSNDLVVPSLRGNVAVVTANAAVSNFVKTNVHTRRITEPLTAQERGTYGWWGGGTGALSQVGRIDFANDSPSASSPRGPLTVGRFGLAAAGNANYGWFGGGSPNGTNGLITVERVDFANDLPIASVRGTLTLALFRIAAVSNAYYGWFGGGRDGSSIFYTSVNRIDFANDSPSASSPRGPLTAARGYLAAAGNSNFGWFIGGEGGGGLVSIIDRIDFANDSPSAASVRGPLPQNRATYVSGTSNSQYGYVGGGFPSTSVIDRIDFANDSPTAASPRGPFSIARQSLAAAGNSNFGWWGGGNPGSRVDRVDFANDSATASTRGPLHYNTGWLAATSNYVKTIPIINVTQYAKGSGVVGTGAGTFGWYGGGFTGATFTTQVDRMDFAVDTATSTVRGPLTVARTRVLATGNSNYGWFGAGFTPGNQTSIVERIDFANDSPTTAGVRASLIFARYNHAATGNSTYGYFMAGQGASTFSSVERIDFSNDFSQPSVRGPVYSSTESAATSNAYFGWFSGGFAGTLQSRIDRIDFANDSPTASSTRGPMVLSRTAHAATSNNNFAWFAGGSAPALTSTIERINFSNDSPTAASPRGPLSIARQAVRGTSNANFGWFFTGGAPAALSTVDRIDFSNDSPTSAVVRGPIAAARYNGGLVSNYTK